MKIILTIITILLFASCNKEGVITDQSGSTYLINGKKYQFVKIIPSDYAHGVWILVPIDSTSTVPLVTKYSYTTSNGKHGSTTHHVNAIIIK